SSSDNGPGEGARPFKACLSGVVLERSSLPYGFGERVSRGAPADPATTVAGRASLHRIEAWPRLLHQTAQWPSVETVGGLGRAGVLPRAAWLARKCYVRPRHHRIREALRRLSRLRRVRLPRLLRLLQCPARKRRPQIRSSPPQGERLPGDHWLQDAD